MSSLTGNLISSTYQSLLKIGTNNTASVNINNVTDGAGNATGLYVSTTTTAVSGTFAVLGSMTVSGVLAATSSNATSASYALSSSFTVSSSFAGFANNANLLDGLDSTVFATTGSNQFKSDQTITGSVSITNVLKLTAQSPLPAASSVPNSFAVSASTPTKPYYSDGTSWNALY